MNVRRCGALLVLCLLAPQVARADAQADLDAALVLALRTLGFVEQSAPRPALAAELARLALARPATPAAITEHTARVKALRRRIILSHPLLAFDRLLINKHPLPVSHFTHQNDQYLGRHSQPGPGLVVLENWRDQPRARPLLADKLPLGAVLNPSLSYDAQRVVFAFCDHSANRVDDVLIPTHPRLSEMWKGYDANKVGRLRYWLYEAATDGSWVRQLTGGPGDPMTTADGRQTVLIEDLDPCYLPDGGIVFTSTRSQNFGRCHWGRYTPAFLLYRCDADGRNIRPLSYGEANEWNPSVLPDGRIVYTRWDYIDRHSFWYQSLWTTYPDGTGTAHFYGNYTQNPCVLAEARAIPGSHRVLANASAHHYYTGGSLLTIDPRLGEDGLKPIARLTPECSFPESEGWNQPGVYVNAWPLSEDLYLCSYTPEKLAGGVWPRTGTFGIWLVDSLGGRELIYRDPENQCFNPVPLTPQARPPVLPSALPPAASTPPVGYCYVQNVYQSRVKLPPGSVRWLRINRLLNQPAPSPAYRNANGQQVIKGVVGTVPVAPDGSVAFSAPAGEPLTLQLLDEHHMALLTMRSLLYLQPGERVGCVGCHEAKHQAAPRTGATRQPEALAPRPLPGPRYAGGLSFARTVQPVLDRWCLDCHGLGGKVEGGINLLGDRAYEQLCGRKGLVTVIPADPGSYISKLRDFYAAAGRLGPLLAAGHAQLKLPPDDRERIMAWLDLNAQKFGDYSFNRREDRRVRPPGEQALRQAITTELGPEWAAQPLPALVNVAEPDESRVLQAPLAAAAGGWGQVARWRTRTEPGWVKLRELVAAAIEPLPVADLAGTCARTPCVCGSCWVRLGRYNAPRPVAQVSALATPAGGSEPRVR